MSFCGGGIRRLRLRHRRRERRLRTNPRRRSAIRRAGEDLLYIINDILDLSKVASGTFQISSVSYEISSLINDVLTIIDVRAKEKSLDLIAEIDPNIPARLIGDDVRIRQVLLNLLSNAVKYTNEGGMVFAVGSERLDDGVNLVFTVMDSGIDT
jgi:signal transduction histidine kinase